MGHLRAKDSQGVAMRQYACFPKLDINSVSYLRREKDSRWLLLLHVSVENSAFRSVLFAF